METVADLIEALGGTSAVAKELNLTPSTVSGWKTSNSLPKWRRDSVAAIASAKGVAITLRGFA